jgi:hypothetical protein
VTSAEPKSASKAVLVIGLLLALATAVFSVAANGNVAAALMPAVGLAVVVAILGAALEQTLAAVLFVSLLLQNPGGEPMGGQWRGPLLAAGQYYFDNLRKFTGVDALRFCVLELVFALVALVAVTRLFAPPRAGARRARPGAFPLKVALAVSFAAIVALVVYGIGRGGDFRQMLWQTRQIGWLPIMAALFMAGLKTEKSIRALAAVVVSVTVLRSLEGLYFYFAIMRPQGLALPYILTHEDSVLFAATFIILFAWFIEQPRLSTFLGAALLSPVVGGALFLNNRRLAYVALLSSAAAIVVLARRNVRYVLGRAALICVPLLAIYVAAGWSSRALIFAPIASLRSVDDAENASNLTRDIENHNLVYTLSRNPLLGSGFGHPYVEVEKGASIAKFMENYRYVAHDSVLWLWSLGGLIGFSLMWLPIVVTVYLARRVYRRAGSPTERVAALATVGLVITYMVQSYGDMGATGWMGALLLAAAMGSIGNLAVSGGAWPARAAGGEM